MASLLSLVLWAGCSTGDEPAGSDRGRSAPVTVVADGQTVEGATLVGTVAGLCAARERAATDLQAAKAIYEGRSRTGVETTIEVLRRSHSILATSVAEAAAGVDADLATDPPGPTLSQTLGRLTENMREGLARLGIPTSVCKK